MYIVASEQVHRRILLLLLDFLLIGLQVGRLLSALVHLDNLLGALCRDGLQVSGDALVRRVRHQSCQDISLEIVVVRVERLQHHLTVRQHLASLHVVIHLVVQAAFQFGTHTSQLLRVQRDILIAGGTRAHRDEVLHPCGAAQLTSAGTRSADAASLLSCTDLLHLDAYVEGSSQVLDQLAEVHALVGDIVEDSLLTVALILHVANLHVQSQVLGNLTALDHRLVLACLRLVILVHIHLACQSVDALDIIGTLQVGLLDLQRHQSACQRHHADIMTRTGLHGHDVTLLQGQVVHIVVVALAGVLELHLHQVGRLQVARHVGQPVVCIQLTVLSAHGSSAESTVTTGSYLVCSLFLFHVSYF